MKEINVKLKDEKEFEVMIRALNDYYCTLMEYCQYKEEGVEKDIIMSRVKVAERLLKEINEH